MDHSDEDIKYKEEEPEKIKFKEEKFKMSQRFSEVKMCIEENNPARMYVFEEYPLLSRIHLLRDNICLYSL